MLEKINSNNIDSLESSNSLDKIKHFGVSDPFIDDERNFFIDESQISTEALKKYQHELDVQNFSDILKNTNQKEADNLVIQQALEGELELDEDNFLSELLNSKEFLKDVI